MLMSNNALPPSGARALIFVRTPRDRQDTSAADDQIEVLRADCRRFGWVVVEEVKCVAKSGLVVAASAGYADMMAAAEAGRVDLVCVLNIDRLGRNAADLYQTHRRLTDLGVIIYTHDHEVMSGLELALRSEMVRTATEAIAERTRRGRREAAGRRQAMGEVPFGYRAAGAADAESSPGGPDQKRKRAKRVKIDPADTAIIRSIYQKYADELTLVELAELLSEQTLRCPGEEASS